MRGFLWPTEFLVFSDFLVADPHAHGALQLSVGIGGSPRVWLDGAWRRARGVLIETDTAHAFDCDGQLTAIGWIEGESRLAEQLRERVLDGRPYTLLDEPLCDHLADGLGPAFGRTTGCPEAYKRWRDALGWLAIDVTPEPEYDDRIAAVLDHLRATPSPPPSIQDLTNIAHLSQGAPAPVPRPGWRPDPALPALAPVPDRVEPACRRRVRDTRCARRRLCRQRAPDTDRGPDERLHADEDAVRHVADELPLTMAPLPRTDNGVWRGSS